MLTASYTSLMRAITCFLLNFIILWNNELVEIKVGRLIAIVGKKKKVCDNVKRKLLF